VKLQNDLAVISPQRPDFSKANTRQVLGRKPGTGLKRVSTPGQDKAVKHLCLSDCQASSTVLKSKCKDDTGIHESDGMMWQSLCEFGLKHYRPLLTSAMKRKHFSRAKGHIK
jgi:hypothetical protein